MPKEESDNLSLHGDDTEQTEQKTAESAEQTEVDTAQEEAEPQAETEAAVEPQPEQAAVAVADAAQEAIEPQAEAADVVAEIKPLYPVPETRAAQKRLAAVFMIFAAAIVFCVYIVQFFHFLEPLFYRVYYGNLKKVFYNVLCVAAWVPMLVGVHLLLKKYTGMKAFRRYKRELPLKRSLLLFGSAVLSIFIVSACLGFELKPVQELGKRVTGVQLWSNASSYVQGGVKLLFYIIFIAVVQEAGELLYTGKYSKFIPWGGIAAMLLFGFGDVIVAYATNSGVMFAWMYLAFNLIYGVLYLIADKSFYVTYIASLIIFIL